MARRKRLTRTRRTRTASDDKRGLLREIVALEKMLGQDADEEIEDEADAIDASPAEQEIEDEAEALADEEADIVSEGLDGEVKEPMDYTDQNTKMSSKRLAVHLVRLAKALMKE